MAIASERMQRYAFLITALALLLLLTATQALAQDNGEYTFSKDVPEQAITFLTTNPYTNASGSMTITFSGVFHANRLTEFRKLGTSFITGDQNGTFVFTPDDPTQPTISGKFRFGLSGETFPHADIIEFNFKMDGFAPDGSPVTLIQAEQAFVNEGGLQITFGKTSRLNENDPKGGSDQ